MSKYSDWKTGILYHKESLNVSEGINAFTKISDSQIHGWFQVPRT